MRLRFRLAPTAKGTEKQKTSACRRIESRSEGSPEITDTTRQIAAALEARQRLYSRASEATGSPWANVGKGSKPQPLYLKRQSAFGQHATVIPNFPEIDHDPVAVRGAA